MQHSVMIYFKAKYYALDFDSAMILLHCNFHSTLLEYNSSYFIICFGNGNTKESINVIKSKLFYSLVSFKPIQ